MQGLQRHSHAERLAIAHTLVPQLQAKFGDNLIAIALVASVAREADRAYSDLEMTVFVHTLPPKQAPYLQRVYEGMLIGVEYITEAHYLELWQTLNRGWWAGGASPLVPLYNAPFIEAVLAKRNAYQHPRIAFLRRAARKQVESQECFGKVLNAIEADNRENLPFLLYAAMMSLFATLAYLNEKQFTFALYVTEAHQFTRKPSGFDALLDIAVTGNYTDMVALRTCCETVFTGMESLFAAEGYVLYDESIDPNIPNRNYAE